MRKMPFFLAAAALMLSSALPCDAEGLGTLMQVGKSMDDADRTLSKETDQFEKVKADLDRGEIKKGMAQSEVIKAYGEPQVAFKDSLTKRDKWVYKPGSSNYFEGSKIYIFFDDEGLVDETRYINK
ncbi:MAG: hypothetical protein PHR74_02080 [Candidatus Omnitrophica bacterium]|jgi:hypothetical protein|nr:hypothetical protein [Candidatus Omnitrophota bacterium]